MEQNSVPPQELAEEGQFAQQNEEQSAEDDQQESSQKFQEGEILSLVRVRFPGNARSFPFLVGKRKIAYGQKVLAMSDRGMAVGYVNSFPYEKAFDKSMLPIRGLSKIADEQDIQQQKENSANEKKAENICIDLVEKLKLDMTITHVEFMHFGKKAVFYFVAPERVDFRELVKELVGQLRMRIELRQISVRDRTAALGSIGACGLQTCCSSFLQNYGNVGIKMAKNQNLALIPSKINGVCGQIKCCIKYEDEVYSDKRHRLPREGEFIQAQNGDRGKVLKLDVLIEQFEMLTDQGFKRRYSALMYSPDNKLPKEWKFPEQFDNIMVETHKLITPPEVQKVAQEFSPEQDLDDDQFYDDEDESDVLDNDGEDSGDQEDLESDQMQERTQTLTQKASSGDDASTLVSPQNHQSDRAPNQEGSADNNNRFADKKKKFHRRHHRHQKKKKNK